MDEKDQGFVRIIVLQLKEGALGVGEKLHRPIEPHGAVAGIKEFVIEGRVPAFSRDAADREREIGFLGMIEIQAEGRPFDQDIVLGILPPDGNGLAGRRPADQFVVAKKIIPVEIGKHINIVVSFRRHDGIKQSRI